MKINPVVLAENILIDGNSAATRLQFDDDILIEIALRVYVVDPSILSNISGFTGPISQSFTI